MKLFKKQQLTKRAKPLELITNQAGNMERRSIMRKVPEIKRKKNSIQNAFKNHYWDSDCARRDFAVNL